MAVSNAQQRVERSIYEALRAVLVAEGYWPDVTQFAYTTAGQVALNAAVDGIIANKGFAIELFTASSITSRGKKRVPRIVISDLEYFPGDVGMPISGNYTGSGGGYTRDRIQQTTSRAMFDITIVSEKISQDRICQAIVSQAFSRRTYIEYYDQPGEYFLIMNTGLPFKTMDGDQGVINKIYRYEIPDILESSNVIIDNDIAKIIEISLDTSISSQDANLAVYSGYCEYFLGSLTEKQIQCLLISGINGGSPSTVFEPSIGIIGGVP